MLDRVCSLLRINPPVSADEGLLLASGAVVPADGTAGYQPGAIFQHTDGGEGTALYVNEGTLAACDFNAVSALTAAQEALLGATAGTVAASKAVVVDANKDVTGFRNVAVAGTLGVTGVATFTAAPKLTATTVAEAKTLTMTNAPAAADAGKATPIYLTVTVGATNYVIPAWPLA